ncbi:ATP-binding protein [Streptomyces sp. NBC_00872]|uniref:ATP-binding protein n=1 Tax=Streptomyces sp. NBC_00872 TaxID=2903686 RepID=UPI003863439F|nr:ATP-binding protein [Streptomyces sp. NBC_00872]
MAVIRTEQARYCRNRPAAKAARARARELAEEWQLTEMSDALESAVSELVSNAVVHGRATRGSRVTVTYELDGARLRVEVRDRATGMPQTVPPPGRGDGDVPERLAEGGRGLLMVGALADRWGVLRHVIGKSVWFELDLAFAAGAS